MADLQPLPPTQQDLPFGPEHRTMGGWGEYTEVGAAMPSQA